MSKIRYIFIVCFFVLHIGFAQEQSDTKKQPEYKKLDWKLNLELASGFQRFRSDSIKHHSSRYTNVFLKVGVAYRPTYCFGVDFYTGIGAQGLTFLPNYRQPTIAQEDLEKLKDMVTDPQLIANIQNAIQTGNFSDVLNFVGWGSFDYNYLRSETKYSFSSYVVPFDVRFAYYLGNKAKLYVSLTYNKGGLIDDASVFIGSTFEFIDVKLGYSFYFSDHTHKDRRVEYISGLPITFAVGLTW
ncbi:hypothetical protein [uncultured Helicobacter sp.]|uniref:hypothetical protein n=1 Tax=uncultured Helicobacter sp. TaxID=175537 RepID=UPI00374E7B82